MLESGRYESPSEIVGAALRLLDEWDRIQEPRLAEFKRDVRLGLEQLDRGESAPLDIEAIKVRARMLRR